ncbi:MAG TPA: NEW3 domain-containing protein [Xanthobacteraceae bacterium]|nr:NEW3 domain-containing protein [Xanthobacteraceae bacterium]
MRGLALALTAAVLALTGPAMAADEPPAGVKGLFLMADFPSITVRPGTTSTVSLRLQNYGLPPEMLEVSVDGVPAGWQASLLGGGQPVAAAMPATNASVSLQLRLEVPANASGKQTLTVTAKGKDANVNLPIVVAFAKDLPAKLSVEPRLPNLRGTAKSSFEYTIAVKNDSGKNLLVSLAAQAPQNFETSFTESYGSQELSSIPIEAGQSKDVKFKVRPPSTVKAGPYAVTMRAAAEDANVETKVALEITGQPQLSLAGRGGVLSATATAGKESTIPIEVTNTGTAPAEDVELSGSGPSGWKVAFEPKTVDSLAPGQSREVQALITPSEKAIAGDYVTSLRATTRGENASANFRIGVSTSTVWGITGVGIIAIALLVLVGAVARFGRR